jgi:hypothetical protein
MEADRVRVLPRLRDVMPDAVAVGCRQGCDVSVGEARCFVDVAVELRRNAREDASGGVYRAGGQVRNRDGNSLFAGYVSSGPPPQTADYVKQLIIANRSS